jgi:hypothetical protein
MGKTVYLSDKEIDFLSRALTGLIVDDAHSDADICENLLKKIEG